MPIAFDRSICCDLNETISREWLVTNGLGGYAAGTVAGVLTRTQHGLLVAKSPDAAVPELLLAKIDEEVIFDRRTYYLGTNEYRDGTLNPAGFVHLETFRLEEGFPVFTYHLGGISGIMLEKRIWMAQGYNTTYIQYRVLRRATLEKPSYNNLKRSGTTGALNTGYGRSFENAETEQHALTLTLLPFSACRPYNQSWRESHERHFEIQVHRTEGRAENSTIPLGPGGAGCTIQATDSTQPYHILAVGHPKSQVTFLPTGVWYWNFLHRHDTTTAGQPTTDDLYLPGVIRANLWPGEDTTLTIIVSSEELTSELLQSRLLHYTYQEQVERQQQLVRDALQPQRYFGEGGEAAQAHHLRILPLTTTSDPYEGGEDYLRQLLQAGDRFLTHYRLASRKYGRDHSIFPVKPESIPVLFTNYYGLEKSTRDALIALPGLTLVTERYNDARRILYELAHRFRDGMLPDRFPLPGQSLEESDYSSVDTTLWYFYALDHYLRVTRDYRLLEEIFHHLKECINRYLQGIHSGIRVDPADGLLAAQQPGKAMTWMNVAIRGVPATAREGKPVEVNALWYNALSLMHEWWHYLSHRGSLGYAPSHYHELLTQCRKSFQRRFWYAGGGYLYDVVDGPGGNDASIRPNQLLALSLRYSVLDTEYQQSVFDVVTQHLLTPYGLRTLAPHDAAYRGHLQGSQEEQWRALHQGSAWCWLLGPYIDAMLAMRCPPSQMLTLQDENLCHEYFWRNGLRLLEPFKERFAEGLLGMSEGVCDGNEPYQPYRPGEGLGSALSTGELLRIYDVLAQMRIMQPERMLSC
ncbi:MAG TPA: amylo-alpha-1,6-glucosidase [Ktedonobacteraceae bacterium]|nr:amylo-alpha-1,6-glucosidase [Ktedonobacteraceae bacterium]